MKHTAAPGEGDEGEDPLLPFGRPTEDQSTRRDTSDAAYARAALSEQREALLRAIKRTPRTCDEIMSLGWAHQSASAGINWLMRQGHIVDSGERRKTSMGRKAIVWRYEPNPVPLKRTRPTRRELEKRIEAAIETIALWDGFDDALARCWRIRLAYLRALLNGNVNMEQ